MFKKPFKLIAWVAGLACLAYFAANWYWHLTHARSEGRFKACQMNLRHMATAIEKYKAEKKGHYPTELAPLVPTCLAKVPQCPELNNYKLEVSASDFTIYCQGRAHEGLYVQTDHPAYSGKSGLDPGELGVSPVQGVLDMIKGTAPPHPADTQL